MRSWSSVFITALFAVGVVTAVAASDPAAVLTGIGTAKDGDGILFGRVEIRLQGIAAPEWNSRKHEAGGFAASQRLHQLVDNKKVRCELDGTTTGPKTGNRPAAICYVDGRDVGATMVREGYARDCPKNSRGRYSEMERQARASGRNLGAIYPLPPYC